MNKIAGMIARSVAEATKSRPNPLIPAPPVAAPAAEDDTRDCGNCGEKIQKARYTGRGWDGATHVKTGYFECDPEAGAESLRAVPVEPVAETVDAQRYNGLAEHHGVRAYVFNFVGKDGRHASVVFDRYGHNREQFEKYGVNQLRSNALGSVIADPAYGYDWIETFSTQILDLI